MITITQLLQILFNIFFGTNLYITLSIVLFKIKYKEMYLPYFIIIEALFYALLLEKLNYDFRIIFVPFIAIGFFIANKLFKGNLNRNLNIFYNELAYFFKIILKILKFILIPPLFPNIRKKYHKIFYKRHLKRSLKRKKRQNIYNLY